MATSPVSDIATKAKPNVLNETVDQTVARAKAMVAPKAESGVITSQTLAPQADFNLTAPAPNVQTGGLQGAIESQTDQFTKNLETKKAETEVGKDTALNQLITSMQNRQGIEGFTVQGEQENGLLNLENDLSDINNQILQEQNSLRRAQERVLAQGGQSKGQAQTQLNNMERDSLAKQADLSIIQLGKQAKYDSARAFIDRKAKALYEQEQNTIDALRLNYNDNKDLFDKSEQRLFETQLGDREAKLQAERDNRKAIDELALDALVNGAPTSVVTAMQAATDKGEAIGLGGQYVGMLDRESKLANIAQSNASAAASYASAANSRTNRLLALAEAGDGSAISNLGFDPRSVKVEVDPVTKRQVEEQVGAGEQLLELTTEYRDLVKEKGFENTIFGNQETAGKYKALRGQITAAYKDAKKLGTLDAGLITLMDGIIGQEPTSTFGVFSNAFGGKSTRIVTQLDTLIDATAAENARSYLRLGINPVAVDLTTLSSEDSQAIDNAFGNTSGTTAQFDPSSYFNSSSR